MQLRPKQTKRVVLSFTIIFSSLLLLTDLGNGITTKAYSQQSPSSVPFITLDINNPYTMDATLVGGVTRLTNNTADDTHPTWSPDGERIAFTSFGNRNADIYVMNSSDGSGVTRLTNVRAYEYDTSPDWSPDGIKIAFISDSYAIYTMNAVDGSGVTPITNDPAGPPNDFITFDPSWSPDGERIAFSSGPETSEQRNISVINVADGSVLPLIDIFCFDSMYGTTNEDPSWSPDGERIAFVSNELGFPNIYTMNASEGIQCQD